MTDDLLSSWNNSAAKSAIIDFVARVTDEDGVGAAGRGEAAAQ